MNKKGVPSGPPGRDFVSRTPKKSRTVNANMSMLAPKHPERGSSKRDILIASLKEKLKVLEDLYKKSLEENQNMTNEYNSAAKDLTTHKLIRSKLIEENKKLQKKIKIDENAIDEWNKLEEEVEDWKKRYEALEASSQEHKSEQTQHHVDDLTNKYKQLERLISRQNERFSDYRDAVKPNLETSYASINLKSPKPGKAQTTPAKTVSKKNSDDKVFKKPFVLTAEKKPFNFFYIPMTPKPKARHRIRSKHNAFGSSEESSGSLTSTDLSKIAAFEKPSRGEGQVKPDRSVPKQIKSKQLGTSSKTKQPTKPLTETKRQSEAKQPTGSKQPSGIKPLPEIKQQSETRQPTGTKQSTGAKPLTEIKPPSQTRQPTVAKTLTETKQPSETRLPTKQATETKPLTTQPAETNRPTRTKLLTDVRQTDVSKTAEPFSTAATSPEKLLRGIENAPESELHKLEPTSNKTAHDTIHDFRQIIEAQRKEIAGLQRKLEKSVDAVNDRHASNMEELDNVLEDDKVLKQQIEGQTNTLREKKGRAPSKELKTTNNMIDMSKHLHTLLEDIGNEPMMKENQKEFLMDSTKGQDDAKLLGLLQNENEDLKRRLKEKDLQISNQKNRIDELEHKLMGTADVIKPTQDAQQDTCICTDEGTYPK